MRHLTVSWVIAQADGSLWDFLHTIRGPAFLILFFAWLLAILGVVWSFRGTGKDTPLVTLIGLLCFEGLGVARFIVGSAHGMHRWGGLIFFMMIGAILILVRGVHFEKSTGSCSSGTSCSSGGSSCSSGGGCGRGGGCGGCGGGS